MKTAIVTGASGNMGQAVVKKYLAEGYRVIGTVDPHDSSHFNIDHPEFEKIPVDLMNEEDAEKFVSGIISTHKSIDIVVATVGGFAMGKIVETKTSDIAKQYKLNFETAYNIARPSFVHMLEKQRGRIFLVGSRPGLQAGAGKGMIAYSMAKSLLFRLAELMNDEARDTDVVTSVIVPGTIDTPPNRLSMPNADFDAWVKPEAIADIIYFYCTPAGDALREPIIKVYNRS